MFPLDYKGKLVAAKNLYEEKKWHLTFLLYNKIWRYCACQEEARRVALKQRAEQIANTETLGWEEEEEGVQASDSNRGWKERD